MTIHPHEIQTHASTYATRTHTHAIENSSACLSVSWEGNFHRSVDSLLSNLLANEKQKQYTHTHARVGTYKHTYTEIFCLPTTPIRLFDSADRASRVRNMQSYMQTHTHTPLYMHNSFCPAVVIAIFRISSFRVQYACQPLWRWCVCVCVCVWKCA